ncbi:alpha/beta fold hydrolase [Nanoarchaeota archaeon]
MYNTSFDGTRIFYRIKRKKLPFLIFLHGWGTNWTSWKKEIMYFERLGYSTLALDLRGHGQSGKPEEKSAYKFTAFAKDLKKIIIKEKIKDFILIGHSMGGTVALKYWYIYKKRPKALVLADTTYKDLGARANIQNVSPYIIHLFDFIMKHEHIRQKHYSHLKDIDLSKRSRSDVVHLLKGLRNMPLKSVFATLETQLKFKARKVLRTIDVPVLLIEGSDDRVCALKDVEKMYEEIKDVDLDYVPKGKHCVNLENAELMDRYIFHFLRGHKLLPSKQR